MTYGDLVKEIQEIYPSEYTAEEMTEWAREVDADVIRNIEKRNAPTGRGSAEDAVLIPEPYDVMYRLYIMAQIAFFQRDFTAYGTYAGLYAEKFGEYAAWWQRTYGSESERLVGWI